MIRMYGADWCGDCRRTKAQLTELGVDFEYLDVEANADYKAKAIEISGKPNIPVVVFADGTHIVEPSNPDIEDILRSSGLISSLIEQ